MEQAEIKAREIYERFLPLVDCGDNRYTTKNQHENTKQCALICVDEQIKSLKKYEQFETFELYKELLDLKQHLNNL